MRLLITGGHVTPALAIIEKINELGLQKKIEVIFVGRKYAQDHEKIISFEYQEITKRKIRFINLKAGRWTRIISLRSIINILKIPLGFIKAFSVLKKEKPDAVLSFGGYIGLPISFCAWIFKVPVYTHEQTISSGIANKLIGYFAKKIFISFAESKNDFDAKKTYITGNPIRNTIFQIIKKPFTINTSKPVIYITGGALGSHSINMLIMEILPTLLQKYTIIHQTGETKEYQDYEELLAIRNKLPDNFKNNYFLAKHVFDDEIGYIYSISNLVVGRAGANTFFELLAVKIPAIFIPLPWSANNEQQKHAEIFAKYHTGKIFYQNENSEKLLSLINDMIQNIKSYKNNFNQLNYLYKTNAAETIIKEILTNN